MMPDVIPYSVGICCASVCASENTTPEEIERAVNAAHPTGVGPWQISEDEQFADGKHANPCACDQVPGRKHWLLNC